MKANVEGYLNPEHNPNLLKEINSVSFNIKKIYIKLIDQEDKTKLKNILKVWDNNDKINIPVSYAKEGGFLIKLNTQKLSKYLGPLMLKTPRKDWFNKKYHVIFSIQKYSFTNHLLNERVQGLHFILKGIDLVI